MKKTFLFVILMLTLATSFAQTPLEAPVKGSICGIQRSDEQHSLHIVSDPIGASIYKNGMNTGFVTPMMFEGMTTNIAGVYHVVMSGYTFDPVNYSYDGTTDAVVNFIGTVVDLNDPPVEITEFSATLTQYHYVQLTWTSQYESNLLGYNVYRSTSYDLSSAIQISELIDGTNTSSPHTYTYLDQEPEQSGTYYYWLQAIDMYGSVYFFGPVSIILVDNDSDCIATPFVTNLEGAYPNPFNPTTNIRYQLDGRGEVKIDIYNTRGQLVRSFSRYHDAAGSYNILWDGRDSSGRALASGVYLYKMTSGSYSCGKKLVLQK